MKTEKTIKLLIGLLITFAIIFFVAGGYLLGKQSAAPTTQNNNMLPITSMPTGVGEISQMPSPTLTQVVNTTQSVLVKVFEEKNADLVKPYLADKVFVLLYASECCGDMTEGQKVADFISGYLKKEQGTWLLNPTDSKYEKLRAEGDFVAVAPSGNSFVFKLDPNKKIEAVKYYPAYYLSGN